MIGTTIRRKGARGARFTITGATGSTWIATPEDFGPPMTLTVADMTSGAYVIEDGAVVTGPDQRSVTAIEREAWARIGARSAGVPQAEGIEAGDNAPAATILTAAEAAVAFDELHNSREGRGVLRSTSEDHFVLSAPPSTEGHSDELRAEAAERVATDILRQHGREAVQAGEVPGITARVLAAVRSHLKAQEGNDR